MLTTERISEQFSNISSDNLPNLLKEFKDDINYTVTGTASPFSGTYTSQGEVLEKVYKPILACFSEGMTGKVRNVFVSGDYAILEITAEAKQKNGELFRQEMCWVCRYEGDKIAELRYYADTAATEKLLKENAGK